MITVHPSRASMRVRIRRDLVPCWHRRTVALVRWGQRCPRCKGRGEHGIIVPNPPELPWNKPYMGGLVIP